MARAQKEPLRPLTTTEYQALERVSKASSARVGATTIRRVLHDAGSSYQRTRTWCPTGTAVRKAGAVRVVDPRTEGKKA